MKFNLAKHMAFIVNEDVGNVPLTYNQSTALLNKSAEPITSLDPGDILCLDLEFVGRVKIDEIRYYFNSSTSSGTVTSGIQFQYLNETYESLQDSPVSIGSGYYYTTISGSSAPRFIRLLHTMASGTAVSGTLHGYEVLSDDSIIDFGLDGTKTEVDALTSKGTSAIYPLPVYNSGVDSADAYLYVEPTGKRVDNTIFLSAAEDGPWVGLKDSDVIIADKDTWSYGEIESCLSIHNNQLTFNYDTEDILVDTIKAYNTLSCSYTLPIFKVPEGYDYSRLIARNTTKYEGTSIHIEQASNDETILMRGSTSLLDYNIYRKLFTQHVSGSYRLGYEDHHVDNDTLIHRQEYITSVSASYGDLKHYRYRVDKETGDSFGIFTTKYACYIFSLLYGATSATLKTISLTAPSYADVVTIKEVEMDPYGGCWLHLYARYGNSGYPINKAGDYLLHFEQDLSQYEFSLYHYSNAVGGISVNKTDGVIWYTDAVNGTVIKADHFGNTLLTYTSEDIVIPGVCATNPDGGCWFVSVAARIYNSLIRITEDGFLDSAIYDFSSTGDIAALAPDGNDALWILDAYTLIYMKTNYEEFGRKMFEITVPYAYSITVQEDGCWVSDLNNQTHFVDKHLGKITRTILSYSSDLRRVPYFVKADVGDGSVWQHKLPLVIDSTWNTLPYKEVNNRLYYLESQKYYQAKLTLNANLPSDMYTNVSLVETWDPDDNFDTSLNSIPVEHRWNTYDDRAVIVNDDLVLKGHGSPTGDNPVFIDTHNKWYIKRAYNQTFDFQVDYTVPVTTISGNVTIDLYVGPHKENNVKDEYLLARITRKPTEIELFVEGHGRTSSNDMVTYNNTAAVTSSGIPGRGTLRIKRDNYDIETLYLYHFDNMMDRWDEISVKVCNSGYYHYPITFYNNKSLVVNLRANASRDVYIHNFKYNLDNAHCYWYLVPPVLDSVYLQKPVVIDSIASKDSKNVYIKLDVPDSSDYAVDDIYDTSILTWWKVKVK